MKFKALLLSALMFLPSLLLCGGEGPREIFTRYYDQGEWGRNDVGEGISGVGSILDNARPYVEYLQKFIDKHHIKSVVDVGCGDWELSKNIRWGSIKYYGYDVVQSVIGKDIERYGTPRIHFICADGVNACLPKADLLICKDVLQHLPNSYIHTLISKFGRFKYCLLTNDISAPSVANPQFNNDIPIGSGRFVDLTLPPFNVAAKTVLTFSPPGTNKRVVLVRPTKKAKNHRIAKHKD